MKQNAAKEYTFALFALLDKGVIQLQQRIELMYLNVIRAAAKANDFQCLN